MTSRPSHYIQAALSVLFFIAVFCFYTFAYSGHMAMQEQFQLWLCTSDYLQEHLYAGGLIVYMGEWVAQFFYSPVIGATILAAILLGIQANTWRISRSKNHVLYPLSFIPSICTLAVMTDGNVLTSLPVGMLLWTSAIALICSIRGKGLQYACAIVIFILLGYISTPSQYSYYRQAEMPASVMLIPILSALFTDIALRFLPSSKKSPAITYAILTIVVAIAGWASIASGMETDEEHFLRYDQMARHERWDDIIDKARNEGVHDTYSAVYVNIALAIKGQLADNLSLAVAPHGVNSLLPEYRGEWHKALPVAEAFYYLGMVNTAQRYTFNAHEAIPNMNKSARCFKRLAETNIINGHYEVARKYLQLLSHTLFYRTWAEKALECLEHRNIDVHPMWHYLRTVQTDDDYLFSSKRGVQLASLIKANKDNYIASQYIVAYSSLVPTTDRPTSNKE